jgi:hypothetical protein
MPCASRRIALCALLLIPVAAHAQKTPAGSSPADAVQQLMKAIADSNLTRVAQLFGNTKGPQSRTHPKDYEKRIVLMQLFLRGGVTAQALGDVPSEKGKGRTVTTTLSHNRCRVTIPFDVVKVSEGWIVSNFDLDRASQVTRPCEAKSEGNPA